MSGLAWYAGRAGLAHRFGSRESGRREPTDSRMLATSAPDWDAALDRFRDGSARLERGDVLIAGSAAEVVHAINRAAPDRLVLDLVRLPNTEELRGNRNYRGIGW